MFQNMFMERINEVSAGFDAAVQDHLPARVESQGHHWLYWWERTKKAAAHGDKANTIQCAQVVHSLCPTFFFADNIWKHPFGFYAQDEQDVVIEAFFSLRPPKSKFFVEVGGFDPFYLSNTRRLINQGWSGIQIEPSPYPAQRLREASEVRVVEAACSGAAGRLTLWETQWPGMPKGGAIACLTKKQVTVGTWKQRGQPSTVLGHSMGTETFDLPEPYPVEVDVRTLDDILEGSGNPQIDLLMLDCEKAEPDVFAGFTLEKYLPTLIISELCTQPMYDRLTRAGYESVCRGAADLYFALRQ